MSKKTTEVERFTQACAHFALAFPHVTSWLEDEDEFRGLLLKVRPDNTVLAVAKGYGPDGGELVCFGAGYGALGALFAIDHAIQGGSWRVDKPWEGK